MLNTPDRPISPLSDWDYQVPSDFRVSDVSDEPPTAPGSQSSAATAASSTTVPVISSRQRLQPASPPNVVPAPRRPWLALSSSQPAAAAHLPSTEPAPSQPTDRPATTSQRSRPASLTVGGSALNSRIEPVPQPPMARRNGTSGRPPGVQRSLEARARTRAVTEPSNAGAEPQQLVQRHPGQTGHQSVRGPDGYAPPWAASRPQPTNPVVGAAGTRSIVWRPSYPTPPQSVPWHPLPPSRGPAQGQGPAPGPGGR